MICMVNECLCQRKFELTIIREDNATMTLVPLVMEPAETISAVIAAENGRRPLSYGRRFGSTDEATE